MEAYFERLKIQKVLAIDPPHPVYDTMRWYLDRVSSARGVAFECIVSTSNVAADDVHLGSSPLAGPYERMADRVVVHRGDPRMVLRGFEFGFPERFQTFDVVHVFLHHHRTAAMTLVLVFDLLKIGGTLVTEGPGGTGGTGGPDGPDLDLDRLFGPGVFRLVGRSSTGQKIFVKMRM